MMAGSTRLLTLPRTKAACPWRARSASLSMSSMMRSRRLIGAQSSFRSVCGSEYPVMALKTATASCPTSQSAVSRETSL